MSPVIDTSMNSNLLACKIVGDLAINNNDDMWQLS